MQQNISGRHREHGEGDRRGGEASQDGQGGCRGEREALEQVQLLDGVPS